MKKALIVLAAVAACASTLAQSSSTVIFKNRNVSTPDPNPTLPNGQPNPNYVAGGNGNGSFNIGIYANNGDSLIGNGNSTLPAGTLPGGVTVGLFYQNNLLATSILGTTAASGAFFVTPSQQEIQIKDAAGNVPAPGSTPVLTVRAWTTSSGGFDAAKTSPTGQWGEWSFTSLPISGAGSPPSLPPNLTPWGTLDNGQGPLNYGNGGFELNAVPEPSTIALGVLGLGAFVLARRRK
jgi:hypothetical protein